jgi:3-hydroxyacyl-[acyl-carrier-protein] dehydratase
MMSLENYYTIIDQHIEEYSATFQIKLNAQHEMFIGHFPEFPLLPGVVQMELMQELLEMSIHQKLVLSSSKNIKFLGMINPTLNNILSVNLNWTMDQDVKLKSEIIFDADIPMVMFKYSAQYTTV